jgi:hypothetical protein
MKMRAIASQRRLPVGWSLGLQHSQLVTPTPASLHFALCRGNYRVS